MRWSLRSRVPFTRIRRIARAEPHSFTETPHGRVFTFIRDLSPSPRKPGPNPFLPSRRPRQDMSWDQPRQSWQEQQVQQHYLPNTALPPAMFPVPSWAAFFDPNQVFQMPLPHNLSPSNSLLPPPQAPPDSVSYSVQPVPAGTGDESAAQPKQKPKKYKGVKRKMKNKAAAASPGGPQPPAPTVPTPEKADRDPILPPSAASGGVPEPTPEYLLRASFLPLASPEPRPILVVIDLNGTLLYRPSSRSAPSRFVERPHARRFLEYCIDTFHVIIWSSARPENVRRMSEQLLSRSGKLERLVAVWGRDKFGLSRADYNRRTQCYKRLTSLWQDPAVRASHPVGDPFWNQGNTVLIDDSVEKARSEPFNAITLPEFVGNTRENPKVLPLVHDYLNLLAMQKDVSTFIRACPFIANPDVVARYQLPAAQQDNVPGLLGTIGA